MAEYVMLPGVWQVTDKKSGVAKVKGEEKIKHKLVISNGTDTHYLHITDGTKLEVGDVFEILSKLGTYTFKTDDGKEILIYSSFAKYFKYVLKNAPAQSTAEPVKTAPGGTQSVTEPVKDIIKTPQFLQQRCFAMAYAKDMVCAKVIKENEVIELAQIMFRWMTEPLYETKPIVEDKKDEIQIDLEKEPF